MTDGGEVVPDSLSGRLRGLSAAVDLVARWTCSQAFRNATAGNGCELLGKILEDIPSKVKAIQTDGSPCASGPVNQSRTSSCSDFWLPVTTGLKLPKSADVKFPSQGAANSLRDEDPPERK